MNRIPLRLLATGTLFERTCCRLALRSPSRNSALPGLRPGRSIRVGRWLDIKGRKPGDTLVGSELYDERSDPGETTDLASASAHQTTASERAARLRAGWWDALPAS